MGFNLAKKLSEVFLKNAARDFNISKEPNNDEKTANCETKETNNQDADKPVDLSAIMSSATKSHWSTWSSWTQKK